MSDGDAIYSSHDVDETSAILPFSFDKERVVSRLPPRELIFIHIDRRRSPISLELSCHSTTYPNISLHPPTPCTHLNLPRWCIYWLFYTVLCLLRPRGFFRNRTKWHVFWLL